MTAGTQLTFADERIRQRIVWLEANALDRVCGHGRSFDANCTTCFNAIAAADRANGPKRCCYPQRCRHQERELAKPSWARSGRKP